MNYNIYNNLINLRNKVNTLESSDNFIINYEDIIILPENLKNFLNVTKDKDSLKNIYKYIYDYIKKENLIVENNKIIVNERLQDLFKIEESYNLNIINLGREINKIIFFNE